MAKFTKQNLLSGFDSVSSLNQNFTNLETFSDTCLTRDGLGPNAMAADLDMNSYRVLNVPDPANANDVANKQYVDDTLAGNITLPEQQLAKGALVSNKQLQNVAGDDSATSWVALTVNTFDDPSSLLVSTTATSFTLPAGTYQMDVTMPAIGAVGTAQMRLWDGSAAVFHGPAVEIVAGETTTMSMKGIFTITANTAFEIQAIADAVVTDAYGTPGNLGPETYLQCMITEVLV